MKLRGAASVRLLVLTATVAAVCLAVVLVVRTNGHTGPSSSSPLRREPPVAGLLRGIPQHGNTLGSPGAPITLQVFGDLECIDVKQWFGFLLPAILKELVRTNIVRLEYRSLKTDTLNPTVFVAQQTAALAAGAQGRMWNFLTTFYREQGTEYTNYVTERYLAGLARQVPGLNFSQWNSDRTIPVAKTVVSDDHAARSFGFHDTPAFRIGRTGGELHNFSGRHVVVYRKFRFPRDREGGPAGPPQPTARRANPLSLIDASDIKKAIDKEL